MNGLDFDRIAELVSPEQLGRVLGAEKVGNDWRCPSPDHDDKRPSFDFFRDGSRTAGKCHALECGLGGSPVSLASVLWGVSPREAAERLVRELGIVIATSGNGSGPETDAPYDYVDEDGRLSYQVVRLAPKRFLQRHPCPEGRDGYTWGLGGKPDKCGCPRVRTVLYHLPQVIEAVALDKLVFVVEGEKDTDRLSNLGVAATTNPGGAGKWRDEYSETLQGARVVIIPDNDDSGEAHVPSVADSLQDVAAEVRVLRLPGLPHKGDVSDWLDAGGTVEELLVLADAAPLWTGKEELEDAEGAPDSVPGADEQGPPVTITDFYAYMPQHKYIFVPTRELWPKESVDGRIAPLRDPITKQKIKPSTCLDRTRPVEQMTWAPGEPMLIEDRLVSMGGWIERSGVKCFNLYRPPNVELGDPEEAGPWLEHGEKVFGEDAEHIVTYLAHRRQKPGEKINHALVLSGAQGTGKDTLLEPAIHAIGPWNCHEVSPHQLMGRFNGFLKSVILRVSEARDLGDMDRYRLYEHLKTFTAAPPFVLRVDEKNLREYSVPNVCGVIITSNHVDGVYLPPDDRRHFVAWTDLTKEDFTEEYWNDLYGWYAEGGYRHVAAYLDRLDISGFNPKAPPPKTAAFWRVVDAGRAPEDAELADALDKLGCPAAVTLEMVSARADEDFGHWLKDRKNRRQIPHRMGAVEYVSVRNDAAKDGRWKVGGRRQVVYARRELSVHDRLSAVTTLIESSR